MFEPYRLSAPPLITGRVAMLPADLGRSLYECADPLAAALDLFRANEIVQEAVKIASPTLHDSLQRLGRGKRDAREGKALIRLFEYCLRMSGRCTPFGTFAAVGTVNLGEMTQLAVNNVFVDARPSMVFMAKLRDAGESDEELRERLRLFENPQIVERGNRIFIASDRHTDKPRNSKAPVDYVPVSMRNTPVVAYCRSRARGGVLWAELVAGITERFGASTEQARAVCEKLWDCGLFYSDLRCAPLSESAEWVFSHLAHILSSKQRNIAPRHVSKIEDAQLRSKYQIDCHSAGEPLAVTCDSPISVDCLAHFDGGLGPGMLKDASRLLALQSRFAVRPSLRAYRRRFYERYESFERLVPLSELTHPDFGLGPPEPYEWEDHTEDARYKSRLYSRAAASAANGDIELALKEDELDAYLPPLPEPSALPTSLDFGFVALSGEAFGGEHGDYVLESTPLPYAPGAGRILGRFAHGLQAHSLLRANVRRSGDEVDAELVYLPTDGKAANVSVRPCPYEYRICVGCRVNDDGTQTLKLEHLYVCVEDNRFRLWSSQIGKFVRVNETHCLNTPEFAPGIARFLSLLAYDGEPVPGRFNWSEMSKHPFLPRVRVGRIILSRAEWNIPSRQLSDVNSATTAIERWRSVWRMPRYVEKIENDACTLVDTRSAFGLQVLVDLCRQHGNYEYVKLREHFPKAAWVLNNGEPHVCEFFVSLNRNREEKSIAHRSIAPVPSTERIRCISHGWSYLRLYVGEGHMDTVVLERITQLLSSVRELSPIVRWHFVRFADSSGPHLRLRVKTDASVAPAALCELVKHAETMVQEREIDRFSIHVYEPEFERYGGMALYDQIEEMFTQDSETVLSALRRFSTREERFAASLVSGDHLVQMFYRNDLPVLQSTYRPSVTKLSSSDWAVIKQIQSSIIAQRRQITLCADPAHFGDPQRSNTFAAMMHMHHNRMGVPPDAEVLLHRWQWNVYEGLLKSRRLERTDEYCAS